MDGGADARVAAAAADVGAHAGVHLVGRGAGVGGEQGGGGAGERELTPPYDLQGLDLSMATASLAVPVGAWRSVIHSAVVFVNESFMDELAAAAGQDPLAYRRRFLTNRRVLGVLDRAAAARHPASSTARMTSGPIIG